MVHGQTRDRAEGRLHKSMRSWLFGVLCTGAMQKGWKDGPLLGGQNIGITLLCQGETRGGDLLNMSE